MCVNNSTPLLHKWSVLGLKQNAKGVGLNTSGRKIIAYVEELATQKT